MLFIIFLCVHWSSVQYRFTKLQALQRHTYIRRPSEMGASVSELIVENVSRGKGEHNVWPCYVLLWLDEIFMFMSCKKMDVSTWMYCHVSMCCPGSGKAEYVNHPEKPPVYDNPKELGDAAQVPQITPPPPPPRSSNGQLDPFDMSM